MNKDKLDHIYAPWRSEYISDHTDSNECTFCEISKNVHLDSKNRVFYRDDICFFVMNLYPYNPAHFMIVPHKHVDSPVKLEDDEWIHICRLAKKGINLLENGYEAHGINFGINIKQAAGAGIPKHLHIHFIPRFIGDTNFITAIGGTRVYGMDFDTIFRNISKLSLKYLKGEKNES